MMIKEQVATAPAQTTFGLRRFMTALAPYTQTILRVVVGFTFLMNGWSKIGHSDGFAGFLARLSVPVPGIAAYGITGLEVLGGLLLILGLGTRWVSILFVIEMLCTTLMVKLPNVGFIADASKPGVGAELDIL